MNTCNCSVCHSSNTTARKITIKRRKDGVYDIYEGTNLVVSRGSVASALAITEALLLED
jgi:hypothetical protein